LVHVFESFAKISVVAEGQELDGGSVLPGCRLPLATILEDVQGTEETST
jgi:hypothetical protein